MKVKYKGFTLIEITLAIVLISILLFITTPLVSNVVARNDVLAAHESLYNALLRAQQLSKNQYKNAQWRVCLDNINKKYTVTSGNCSDPTNAETIKISSNITISSDQTLDILFKAISGELDNISNSITITLTGGGASKSIKINPSGVIDKEANITSGSTTTIPSIVTNGLVLHLDAGNINSYPGLNGTGNNWLDISGNNNNGTLVNGVGYNGANGVSLSFDGLNDYVNIGNQNIIGSGTAPFSVEMWFYNIRSFSAGQYTTLATLRQDTEFFINLYRPTDTLHVYSAFRGQNQWGIPVVQSDYFNKWICLNVVYNGGNKSTASSFITYLNSTQLPTPNVNFGTAGGSSNSNTIGTDNANVQFHQGNIGSYKVYNRALSAAEIQQNFNATRGRFGL